MQQPDVEKYHPFYFLILDAFNILTVWFILRVCV